MSCGHDILDIEQRLERLIESLSYRVEELERQNKDLESRVWMLEYPNNNYE